MKTYQQYINGAWVAPLNGKYTEVYNPSDDSVVGMVANGDEKDADLALQAAQAAQKSWAKLTARRRTCQNDFYRARKTVQGCSV